MYLQVLVLYNYLIFYHKPPIILKNFFLFKGPLFYTAAHQQSVNQFIFLAFIWKKKEKKFCQIKHQILS